MRLYLTASHTQEPVWTLVDDIKGSLDIVIAYAVVDPRKWKL